MNTYTNLAAANTDDADRFLLSVDMKVGAYTLDQTTIGTQGAKHVSVTHASVGTTDTLGTVTIVGRNLAGQTISEVITPVADSTVEGTKWFLSLISATGAGWVIDAVEGTEDTITIGFGDDTIVAEGHGTLAVVVVNTTANGAITIADSAGTIGQLKASIAEGSYSFGDVSFSGYLSVDLAAASDVTFVHSGSLPQSFAM